MSDLLYRLRAHCDPESDEAAAELARLTAENAALKDHNGTIVKLGAENDRLWKENAALRADAEKLELVRMTLAGFFRKELTMFGCVMVIESFVNPENVTPDDIKWAQEEIVRIDSARAKESGGG